MMTKFTFWVNYSFKIKLILALAEGNEKLYPISDATVFIQYNPIQ